MEKEKIKETKKGIMRKKEFAKDSKTLKPFHFSQYGKVIFAENLKDAEKKLNLLIKNKNE